MYTKRIPNLTPETFLKVLLKYPDINILKKLLKNTLKSFVGVHKQERVYTNIEMPLISELNCVFKPNKQHFPLVHIQPQ